MTGKKILEQIKAEVEAYKALPQEEKERLMNERAERIDAALQTRQSMKNQNIQTTILDTLPSKSRVRTDQK